MTGGGRACTEGMKGTPCSSPVPRVFPPHFLPPWHTAAPNKALMFGAH